MKKVLLVPLILLAACTDAVYDKWDDVSKKNAIDWCRSIGGDGVRFKDTSERTAGRVVSYVACFKGYDSLGIKEIIFFNDIIKIGG